MEALRIFLHDSTEAVLIRVTINEIIAKVDSGLACPFILFLLNQLNRKNCIIALQITYFLDLMFVLPEVFGLISASTAFSALSKDKIFFFIDIAISENDFKFFCSILNYKVKIRNNL